jgi:rod shape-determining protein MreD
MVSLVFLLSGLFCVLVQTNLSINHLFFPFKPDLTIPLTVYVALSQRPLQGSLYALWAGFLMDLTSGASVGLYVFTRQLVFFLAHLVKRGGLLDSVLLQGVLSVAFFFLDASVIYIIARVAGDAAVEGADFFQRSGRQAVFTLLLWYLLSPALKKLEALAAKAE